MYFKLSCLHMTNNIAIPFSQNSPPPPAAPLPRLRSPKFLISDVTSAYKVNNPSTNPIKQATSLNMQF